MADKNVQLINYGAVDNLKPKTDAILVAITDEDGDSSNVEREIVSLRQWEEMCFTSLTDLGNVVSFYNAKNEGLASIDLTGYALKADSIATVDFADNTLTFKNADDGTITSIDLSDLTVESLSEDDVIAASNDEDSDSKGFLDYTGLRKVFELLKGMFLSVTESQTLTEEQKETARNNLGIDSAGGDNDEVFTYIIGSTPNYYKRPSLPTSNRTTVTIAANTQVNIGSKGYVSNVDTTLDISTLGSASDRAGRDAYIYACQPSDEESSEPEFVLSFNSTVPDGYTENNSRKIGGFHCLCLAVGTISGHTLSGYDTGDVIPNSMWDLLHRAHIENEGMAEYTTGVWVGIYLAGLVGGEVVSAYGAECIDGYSSIMMHGEKMVEEWAKKGARLPTRDEFCGFAKGSNEGTPIQGESDAGTTGGHVDTAGRRMVSNYGLEDCCGFMYQWCQDIWGNFNAVAASTYSASIGQYGGANTSGNHYLQGYSWDSTVNSDGTSRQIQTDIDGDNYYGDSYGVLARVLAGGGWGSGSNCGSRCVYLNSLSSYRNSPCGGRLASGPRVVNL